MFFFCVSPAASVTDKPVMAGPSGMKKTGDSDVMDDDCGGAEDTNELIRHGGKFPPPIDTGGNGAIILLHVHRATYICIFYLHIQSRLLYISPELLRSNL